MPKAKDITAQILNGPRETARFGRTLIVDVAAPQMGLVVERGSNVPRASVIVTTCAREIISLSKEGVKVETIVVVGSEIDPTEHPDLREVTENLRTLRDKWFSKAKLLVMTQTRDLSSYETRATLAMYSAVHLQFDWGTSKTFTAITGEKGPVLTQLVEDCHHFDHLILDLSLFKAPVDNTADAELAQLAKKLEQIKPQEVAVMNALGSAKGQKGAKAATKPQRDKVIEKLAEATGLSVHPTEHEELTGA
ncbi:MAG: hypothetical protein AAFZ87_04825 [Planctomycetota bacterium]